MIPQQVKVLLWQTCTRSSLVQNLCGERTYMLSIFLVLFLKAIVLQTIFLRKKHQPLESQKKMKRMWWHRSIDMFLWSTHNLCIIARPQYLPAILHYVQLWYASRPLLLDVSHVRILAYRPSYPHSISFNFQILLLLIILFFYENRSARFVFSSERSKVEGA